MLPEFVGWFGAVLLATCGIPQAIISYKQGHSDGLAFAFIFTWWFGEVLITLYTLDSYGINLLSLPLLVNYVFNTFLTTVILKYKIFPRRKQ